MATIRVQKNKDYSVISNVGLNDANLSFKAKGILAYLLSKPDDWTCQVQDLSKNSTDGRDSVYNGLKELRASGYLIKRPIKVNGKVTEWEEILFEIPSEEAIDIYKKQKISRDLSTLKRAEAIKNGTQKSKATTYGFPVTGADGTDISVNIISTNLPSTDLPSTNLLVVDAVQHFEDNICKLKKTTKTQFEKYCSDYDIDFIMATIELCAEINTESFAGFKTIIGGYIEKNITSRQALETYVSEYRNTSKKLRDKEREKRKNRAAATSNKNKPVKGNFNDYEQRAYDFDELEKKLLGWDNKED
ncbi:helix-turn-helix domain-containing protein [Clostridium estertheticum]|uniref:helix-turn-helix domain-containing protein n=1 Tax=Clostridium estertheticum TaxID=238834 RepID=UPI001CF18200|nr:helix-turn-helix domain-containing protein [Clostridium estertheticum]MCB2308874.1 helix-turn-helix domain-containing protein [Clostridium estertheticum]MCB2347286.1 helix-turn-helix domain-containing protein [Clostridium estertheticum]MCB2351947.1 helix-turn-helix domain-containing protein [Clostridium estertheticum]WAG48488.1 helix-turn-helix domain-containing protein [Clostridium estertheticum]